MFSTKKLSLAVLAAGSIIALAASSALAESHARIVRLSVVEGSVQVDRNAGNGYEKAFMNLPLTQGTVLATEADSRAEVELEDGSTLRLTPKTTVEFSELALSDAGGRISTITLKAGQVYVNYGARQKSDEFTLIFGQQKVRPDEAAHFRLDLEDATAEIAVFKGDLKVDGPAGVAELSKNKSATFDLADDNKFTIAKNVEEDPYDEWDKQQVKYHEQYAKNGSYNDSPYGYGVSDMNYYGSYSNVPGYGNLWQPYFASSAWNPFMDGAWVNYPGFGYTFVSAYPWGWMPYYYGSWVNVPGYGWGWLPGGYNNWNTVPRVTNPPNRTAAPVPPARRTGTVLVGRGFTGSNGLESSRVLVRPGSVSYGVPRGVADLNKVSHQVHQNGFATIRTTPPSRSSSGWYGPGSPAHVGSMSSGGGHVTSGGGGHVSSGGGGGHAPGR
jgi:ferric-dicitrate binding protein FerR (iron transport regulator)